MLTEQDLKPGDSVRVKVDGELVVAIYEGWHQQYNMAIVKYEGRRIYRKPFPMHSTRPAAQVVQSKFDVNVRFGFIETLVDMVVGGQSKSVIITGSGGLGKTYTVMDRLKRAGLLDVDEDDVEEGHYQIVKGFTTPKSLYRLLHANRNRILVFDDCDSVWENPTAVSLLKAALDSYETRRITWMTELKADDDDLPQTFLFEGKIVFVSNLSLKQLDQAVLSRCLYVDVSMTQDEKIARIRAIMSNIRKDVPASKKEEALELLTQFKDQIGDLNIRTFLQVLDIATSGHDDWKNVAEYVVTAL